MSCLLQLTLIQSLLAETDKRLALIQNPFSYQPKHTGPFRNLILLSVSIFRQLVSNFCTSTRCARKRDAIGEFLKKQRFEFRDHVLLLFSLKLLYKFISSTVNFTLYKALRQRVTLRGTLYGKEEKITVDSSRVQVILTCSRLVSKVT